MLFLFIPFTINLVGSATYKADKRGGDIRISEGKNEELKQEMITSNKTCKKRICLNDDNYDLFKNVGKNRMEKICDNLTSAELKLLKF